MTIVLADEADVAAILALQKTAYLSEAAIYDDYSIPPLTESLEQARADFRRQTVFKATIGGRIVGSVRGRLEQGTVCIGRLMVLPEHQGRGIGTALLARLEQHFADAECFELFTGDKSERNLRLYGKLGYRVVGSERQTDKVSILYLQKPGRDAGQRGPDPEKPG